MHYIKEIFLGKPVDYMHNMFTRYSRGTFDGAALTIKNGPTIKAVGSVHYTNILGELIANNCQQELKVSGVVHAKREIKIPLEVKKQSKKKGVHIAEVNTNIHSDGLKMVYGDYKEAYILLNLNASEGKWKLKCKKKPPRPGGKLDTRFCSAVLEQNALDNLMEEILFDHKDKNFKTVELKHQFIIEELVADQELKKDAARYRLEAKRKGKIKRTLTTDGKTTETEHEFSV